MNKSMKTEIRETGIEGLDQTLEGGIPEGHVVLLTGESGTGKTVLSMQWLFDGWKKFGRPGIYISVTEPFTKAIKNIASMDFYDRDPLESGDLRFTDLRSMIELMDFGAKGEEIDRDDIDELVERIEELVDETGARRMVLDSITAVGYMIDDTELFRYLIFRLGTVLSGKGCTVFLTSEARNGSTPFNVEDFISDGILNLTYTQGEQAVIRKMEVRKMRGVDFRSGNMFFDISSKGITVYPKIPVERRISKTDFQKRKNTGVEGLDEMLQGGYPEGHIILITGNTGTGKTTFCMQYLAEGVEDGENCVFVNLEEPLPQVKKTAKA
ncbi:MAG: ATPase domain-containing protein, partial [Candidatus Aenigmatarchaeota archaeon]